MSLKLSGLRVKLNQMTERIVSRLKDRSRYKLNEVVYIPNAIPIESRKDLSFFEYALEGIEKYHETLGRFNFPDQTPLIIDPSKVMYVKREIPPSKIMIIPIIRIISIGIRIYKEKG